MNVERSRRPVDAGDEDFLWGLYASTRAEEIAAWGWTPEQQIAFLRMQYTARRASYAASYPEAEHSILLEDGAQAGALIVSRANDEIFLVDVAFLPEWRGRGYGGEVLAGLAREAVESGRAFRLTVARGNPAVRLYQRHGFVSKSEDDMYIEMVFQSLDLMEPKDVNS